MAKFFSGFVAPCIFTKKSRQSDFYLDFCLYFTRDFPLVKYRGIIFKKKSCVPCACGASMYPTNVDHQQNIFKIGNPSGEPGLHCVKKEKEK